MKLTTEVNASTVYMGSQEFFGRRVLLYFFSSLVVVVAAGAGDCVGCGLGTAAASAFFSHGYRRRSEREKGRERERERCCGELCEGKAQICYLQRSLFFAFGYRGIRIGWLVVDLSNIRWCFTFFDQLHQIVHTQLLFFGGSIRWCRSVVREKLA